jgi:hypothetical protein
MPIVLFTAKQAAKDLWEFGEDAYIEPTLKLDDKTLRHLHSSVLDSMNAEILNKLGGTARSYDLGSLTAIAVVAHFEGAVRPLKRRRRRNSAQLPPFLHSTLEEVLKQQMKFTPQA